MHRERTEDIQRRGPYTAVVDCILVLNSSLFPVQWSLGKGVYL